MQILFCDEEIRDLFYKISEIQRISSLSPNPKYSDNVLNNSMLEIIDSLALISLVLIYNDKNISLTKFTGEDKLTKEYVINMIFNAYNYMKIYEIENIFM